jgi:DNA-binding LytR/AlgR family response regulator
MEKYKAILVDDEQESINYMSWLVNDNLSEIDIIATSTNSRAAISNILTLKPDLIFLDIEIDERNGFDIIKEISNCRPMPYIIFVTAYRQFAIDAFKANALDYLLKPVDNEELVRVFHKFISTFSSHRSQAINQLISHFEKIKINTNEGCYFMKPEEILYAKACGNYTSLFTTSDEEKVMSQNLGKVHEEILGPHFTRISRSTIINPDYLREINRKNKTCKLKTDKQDYRLKYRNGFLSKFFGQ